MTNFEKYSGTLKTTNFGLINGVPIGCAKILNSSRNGACEICRFFSNVNGEQTKSCGELRMYWLLQEYEEPKINIPSETPIDTKVLVSNDGITWNRRYYAGLKEGKHHAWAGGKTSWNSEPEDTMQWKYMNLYE